MATDATVGGQCLRASVATRVAMAKPPARRATPGGDRTAVRPRTQGWDSGCDEGETGLVDKSHLPYLSAMKSNAGHAGAILLAGGRGARAGFSANKAYVPVGGRPMISYSLRTLDRCPWVAQLVLVIRPEDRPAAERIVEQVGITTPWLMATGGDSRHASEYRGLEALSGKIARGQIDLVAIHDGARPFVSPSLLRQLFRDADRHGGAVPTLPVDAPTHRLTGHGKIVLLNQERLHKAQTPQVFSAPELLAAYRRAQEAGFEGVDTAETVERFSDLKMRATPGDPNNLKLTFPEDFTSAETNTRDS